MKKRLGGVWFRTATSQWVYKDENKKIVVLFKGLNTPDEQARAESQWEGLNAEYQRRTAELTGDSEITILMARYLSSGQEGTKPQTRKKATFVLDLFCKSFGQKTPNTLKIFEIEDWLQSQDTWGQSTKATNGGILRTAFRWLEKKEYIQKNPFRGISLPSTRARGVECAITPEIHAKLMQHPDETVRDILQVLYATGARPSEILQLQGREYFPVTKKIVKIDHKLSHKGLNRYIMVHSTIASILDDRKAKFGDGFLFLNKHGKPYTPCNLMGRIVNFCRKAKIEPEPILYGYRHAFAIRALQAGVDPASVAALLGHKATKTLFRNYGHLLETVETRLLDLDRILANRPEGQIQSDQAESA